MSGACRNGQQESNHARHVHEDDDIQGFTLWWKSGCHVRSRLSLVREATLQLHAARMRAPQPRSATNCCCQSSVCFVRRLGNEHALW
nr:hypothetical protein CFP56_64871 [Quercus suber]